MPAPEPHHKDAITREELTRYPRDGSPLGPCETCQVGNHAACTGVGCYRCPGPHRYRGKGGAVSWGRRWDERS